MLFVSVLTPTARASCVSAPLQLLWTYPEAGAKDVPADATFWALMSLGAGKPKATLDGQPLSVEDPYAFGGGVRMRPATLTPGADHVLVLDFSATVAKAGQQTHFEIAFRTADAGAATEPSAPVIMGHALRQGEPSDHACADVINAQDCFDTGQSTFLSFQVSAPSDTEGWTISRGQGRSDLWPARCGEPTTYVRAPTSRECYQLRRIAHGGQLSQPVEHCVDPAASGAAGGSAPSSSESAGDSGCAAVGGGRDASALWTAGVLLWLAVRRNGRRRR